MKSAAELRRELRQAEEREARAKAVCTACDGKGWVCDTTYDRCGVDMRCDRCHGSGLPIQQVNDIIAAAITPFRKQMREGE